MFGLCVRFTCRDADSAAGFDRLMAEMVPRIREHEEQAHVRRFLAARGQYLAAVEVDFLTLQAGQGTDR